MNGCSWLDNFPAFDFINTRISHLTFRLCCPILPALGSKNPPSSLAWGAISVPRVKFKEFTMHIQNLTVHVTLDRSQKDLSSLGWGLPTYTHYETWSPCDSNFNCVGCLKEMRRFRYEGMLHATKRGNSSTSISKKPKSILVLRQNLLALF